MTNIIKLPGAMTPELRKALTERRRRSGNRWYKIQVEGAVKWSKDSPWQVFRNADKGVEII